MTVPFATPDHVQGILAKREEKQQQRRREKNPADSGRRRRQHRGEEHEDEQEHTQTAEDEDFASYVASKAQKTALEAANSRLLVKKGTVWYGMLEEFFGPDGNAGLDSEGGPALVKPQDVERLKKEGTAKLAEQVLLHEKEQGLARSDAAWTRTILRDGTASDRCSALVLAAQASPVHGLAHIQALLAMAQGRSRHDALLALDALRELFNSKKDAVDEIPLLPPHRKLLYLHQQPRLAQALALDDRQRPLAAMLWVFEETLKTVYLSTIRVLEVLSQDAIAHGRSRATRLLFDLLTANPHEQPANILALLANKLGDPERRLASRIPYYLTELVNAHP
jgi:ribosome biogenesis protein MAK21